MKDRYYCSNPECPERWMKELPDVPITGIVSDKEKALVAAFDEVFPGVPHQSFGTTWTLCLQRRLDGADSVVT